MGSRQDENSAQADRGSRCDLHLDAAPAGDKILGEAGYHLHQPLSAISLDSRIKAWAVAAKVEDKGPCDAIAEAGLLFSARLS